MGAGSKLETGMISLVASNKTITDTVRARPRGFTPVVLNSLH